MAKDVAERNAEKEARQIAEEKARLKAEALAREEAIRKEKQLQEERKQREILSRKRKLAYQRNKVQMELYSTELDRKEWNKDYVAYLESEFIREVADMSEEELATPIMTKEEFESQQAVNCSMKKLPEQGNL